ncbi:hypothetical protein HMPREF9373_2159 [Psychrobacter sp. 1501(2011)]|nr:hypothetical protein HMPREF9373_2159 [Psychrobacter sp. 1501(2011)]
MLLKAPVVKGTIDYWPHIKQSDYIDIDSTHHTPAHKGYW